MMKIKGTGLKTTKDFVKQEFPHHFERWYNALPESSQALYKNFSIAEWYPLKEAFLVPLDLIIEMFFDNNVKEGAEAIGKYSAEVALKGVYKVFLMVSTPAFLIKRAPKIISTYYEPSDVEAHDVGKKTAIIRITRFAEINVPLEIRIAAWCVKALELTGCRNVSYKINTSLARGDKFTEVQFNWE